MLKGKSHGVFSYLLWQSSRCVGRTGHNISPVETNRQTARAGLVSAQQQPTDTTARSEQTEPYYRPLTGQCTSAAKDGCARDSIRLAHERISLPDICSVPDRGPMLRLSSSGLCANQPSGTSPHQVVAPFCGSGNRLQLTNLPFGLPSRSDFLVDLCQCQARAPTLGVIVYRLQTGLGRFRGVGVS